MTSSLDLPVLARAVVAECHRLGGLNHRYMFLTVLEALKSKIKTLMGLVSDEKSLPGFHTAAFLVCPHMAFLLCVCPMVSLPLFIGTFILVD